MKNVYLSKKSHTIEVEISCHYWDDRTVSKTFVGLSRLGINIRR